jgi:hypothetical protein
MENESRKQGHAALSAVGLDVAVETLHGRVSVVCLGTNPLCLYYLNT